MVEIETPQVLIDQTYKRAKEAFLKTRQLSLRERLKILSVIQKCILSRSEDIVDRIIDETSKCRTDALVSEILGVLDHLEYLKKNAEKILCDKKVKTPLTLMGKKSFISFEPLGVVLVISPWNYPFYLGLIPIISAFVAGNAVIYKPSEHTPLKGLIEKILQESNMIKNAIQVVYGSGVTAQRLIQQRPAKIFFTGSVKTGKMVMEQASHYLIPVELELGGKDPMIVFDDINLNRTTSGALWGALTNCGQSCTSIERVYVHEIIYDDFVSMLEQKILELKINEKSSMDTDVGGMTTKFQVDIVQKHIEDAKTKGARILTGGRSLTGSFAFLPTLMVNTDQSMDIMKEETFGPIIPVVKFRSEEEVVNEANNSPFGLSASVWSKDISRAKRVAKALNVGNVSINNVMLTEANPALPFGGLKDSGFGRIKGKIGLIGFTSPKSILMDKQSKKIEANWYPYTQKKYHLFQCLIHALYDNTGIARLLKVALSGLRLEAQAQKKRH